MPITPRIIRYNPFGYGGSGMMPIYEIDSEASGTLTTDKCPNCGAQQKCEYCSQRKFKDGKCEGCGAPQK